MRNRTGALSPKTKADRLNEIPWFAVLTPEIRESLAEKLIGRRMVKGQMLFLQEDPGDELFLLLDGCVRISYQSLSGREITLARLRDGGFFGEMALLDDRPRSASVQADSSGQLLVLRRKDFHNILLEHPQAAVSLLALLSQRLRDANLKIQDLALLSVRERLAAVILDLAEKDGEPNPEGLGVLLPKDVSHKSLAGLLGTSRETVTRMCAELRERGLICQSGRRLSVLDIGGLRELLSESGAR